MEYISFEHNNIAADLVKQAYDTPPLAFVHSYGCQQNVNDGERIKGVLVDIGYGLCDKPEDADLILFNTCAVREHSLDNQSLCILYVLDTTYKVLENGYIDSS